MIDDRKIVGYDFDVVSADGSDNLTQTIKNLLNEFPEIPFEVTFQKLGADDGMAMFPNPSVAILTEKESITGHVSQICAYAFTVVRRTKSTRAEYKLGIKENLDNLGRWLEQVEYPVLEGDKRFIKISRQTQAYLYDTTDDKAEDWAISFQASYTNEFKRK